MTDTLIEEYYQRACNNGMSLILAAQCSAEVMRRVESGRSFDCDEFRELQRYAYPRPQRCMNCNGVGQRGDGYPGCVDVECPDCKGTGEV